MTDLRWPTYPSRGVVLDTGVTDGEGGALRVRDTDGKEYLDAIAGIGCCALGHGHPLWVEAIQRQLGKLASAANSFHTVPQQQLADRLCDLFPVDDPRVFFANTGTEATEAAIKLALRATGRDVIVVYDRAFHGRTLAALSLTAKPAYREPYLWCEGEEETAPRFAKMNVVRVPFGDLDATRAVLEAHRDRVAAVFVEPVQGEGGVFPASREFLLGLRELCDAHGALLGVDEIQCGSGRTGEWSAWTAICGADAPRPDIIWLAKALGNGFPIGACITSRKHAEAMTRGSHGTTFGGNPVACAAALATLRIVEEEGLLAKAGAQLPTLRAIAEASPIDEVTEIRGLGAMIGIQIGAPEDARASAIGPALMGAGILATLPGGHTVRLLLPFAAAEGELRQIWEGIRTALAETPA